MPSQSCGARGGKEAKAIESSQGLELRAGGGLHGPEKPGWSAGGMAKQLGNVKIAMNEKQQQMKNKNE